MCFNYLNVLIVTLANINIYIYIYIYISRVSAKKYDFKYLRIFKKWEKTFSINFRKTSFGAHF